MENKIIAINKVRLRKAWFTGFKAATDHDPEIPEMNYISSHIHEWIIQNKTEDNIFREGFIYGSTMFNEEFGIDNL